MVKLPGSCQHSAGVCLARGPACFHPDSARVRAGICKLPTNCHRGLKDEVVLEERRGVRNVTQGKRQLAQGSTHPESDAFSITSGLRRVSTLRLSFLPCAERTAQQCVRLTSFRSRKAFRKGQALSAWGP